jgi:hypothetical protein
VLSFLTRPDAAQIFVEIYSTRRPTNWSKCGANQAAEQLSTMAVVCRPKISRLRFCAAARIGEHLRSLPKMEYHSLTAGTLLKNRLAIKIIRLNYFHVCRLKYCKRNYCSHAKAAEQQRPLGVGAQLVERAERASERVGR